MSDSNPPSAPRIVVITCAVLEVEIEHYLKQTPNVLAVRYMEQGLHNEPRRLYEKVQAEIDLVEAAFPDADAIVLGYGLCSRGTEGVHAQRCRLVMTRAHDCITLLLGSKEKYAQHVADHPGTYWYSPGWNKHHLPPGKERYEKLLTEYHEKYGEDNAEFLMEHEQHWFSTYERAAYVDLTVGATEKDLQFTRDCADWLKWKFERISGDPDLLIALLRGDWDPERFVVLEPGQSFRAVADERVLEATDNPKPIAKLAQEQKHNDG